MGIQQSIAGALMNVFGSAKQVEETIVAAVENEISKVEQVVTTEGKSLFDQARESALAANDEVNKLKADLQAAMAKAANLHQAAVDAANAARAAAEADVAKFTAMAAAHAADLATQSSTQTITPATPVQPQQ